ncbi:MAG: HAD family phosphatase [Opitutaceae bacterium]|nr:HAD family phosphatase [Cytophagales bacterium]
MRPGIIFDMDGVIIVNMHIHEQAFYELGKRYGKNLDKDFFLKNVSGSTNDKIMPKIFGNISDEDIHKFSSEKEQIYRDLYRPEVKLTDGLKEFFEYLHDLHIPMSIASNAPEENILFICEVLNLQKYFLAKLHSHSVKNPKPAPDMFLMAADKMNVLPKDCIVFEDAPGGISAAYAAGMTAISLLTTHDKEEFEKADLFIKDFNDKGLYDLIKNHMANGIKIS